MVRFRIINSSIGSCNFQIDILSKAHFLNYAILILVIAYLCSSCASISRGVTEGVLNSRNQDREDVRECNIRGSRFKGLQASLDHPENNPTLKVLMVHGIGEHLQGYSTRMQENLAAELNLNVVSSRFKEITLTSDQFPDEDLGKLRIHRFTNDNESKVMIFYELTWSPISEREKEILAFDDSGEHSFRRASINNTMKGFMNSHVSDPLIYLGKAQDKILISVLNSLCWMMSRDWDDLEEHTAERCNATGSEYADVLDDEFAFISHSMGSRIVTDSLQALVQWISDEQQVNPNPDLEFFIDYMQNKRIPVYMLANQLPLLQLGRPIPEVTNQHDAYCKVSGTHYDKRFVKELTVVAFSDPNDIVSYDVPPKFVDEFMDDRLCVNLINVTINIAHVVDLFGLGTFANVSDAHREYDNDERVVGIIVHGLKNQDMAEIVRERCDFQEAR